MDTLARFIVHLGFQMINPITSQLLTLHKLSMHKLDIHLSFSIILKLNKIISFKIIKFEGHISKR